MTVEQRMERFTEAEALDLAATARKGFKIVTEKVIGRRIPHHTDDDPEE